MMREGRQAIGTVIRSEDFAMINGYPFEEELSNRINRQISWRGSTDVVTAIWRGYLAGLVEWGLIDVYERLLTSFPQVGNSEMNELFADEPFGHRQECETDELMKQSPSSLNIAGG